jgi:hypothetical protein
MKKFIPLFLLIVTAAVLSFGATCGMTGGPIDFGSGGGQGEGYFIYDGTTLLMNRARY